MPGPAADEPAAGDLERILDAADEPARRRPGEVPEANAAGDPGHIRRPRHGRELQKPTVVVEAEEKPVGVLPGRQAQARSQHAMRADRRSGLGEDQVLVAAAAVGIDERHELAGVGGRAGAMLDPAVAGRDVLLGALAEARLEEIETRVAAPRRRPEPDRGDRMRAERRRVAPGPLVLVGRDLRRPHVDILQERETVREGRRVEPAALVPYLRLGKVQAEEMERLLAHPGKPGLAVERADRQAEGDLGIAPGERNANVIVLAEREAAALSRDEPRELEGLAPNRASPCRDETPRAQPHRRRHGLFLGQRLPREAIETHVDIPLLDRPHRRLEASRGLLRGYLLGPAAAGGQSDSASARARARMIPARMQHLLPDSVVLAGVHGAGGSKWQQKCRSSFGWYVMR